MKQAVSQSLIGRSSRPADAPAPKTGWIRWTAIALFAVTLSVLAACSGADIDNKEAVQAAVVDYLQSRKDTIGLDLSNMDVVVNAVTFERDTAHASVSFVVRGTDQGMNMNYALKRDGDKWVVEGPQDATMPAHGFDAGAIEPGAEMPAGHPAVGGAGEEAGAQ